MQGDVLVFQGKSAEEKNNLNMSAFVMGFSRSTRLSVLRESLEVRIQVTRKTTKSRMVV